MPEIVYAVATLVSALAALAAWVAKLRWSSEYKETKEAQIDLLKQHVEFYRDMTPSTLRDNFEIVKKQLLELNRDLERQLDEKNSRIKQLESGTGDSSDGTQILHHYQDILNQFLDERIDSLMAPPVSHGDTIRAEISTGAKSRSKFKASITPASLKQGERYKTTIEFSGRVNHGFFDNYVEHQGSDFRTWNWDPLTLKNSAHTTPGELNGHVDILREYSHSTSGWPPGDYLVYVRLYSHTEPGKPGRRVVQEQVIRMHVDA